MWIRSKPVLRVDGQRLALLYAYFRRYIRREVNSYRTDALGGTKNSYWQIDLSGKMSFLSNAKDGYPVLNVRSVRHGDA
jgi:hypothetical protein